MADIKKDRSELNWFLRLITLGDRFSIRDFYDRLKKRVCRILNCIFWGTCFLFGRAARREL